MAAIMQPFAGEERVFLCATEYETRDYVAYLHMGIYGLLWAAGGLVQNRTRFSVSLWPKVADNLNND